MIFDHLAVLHCHSNVTSVHDVDGVTKALDAEGAEVQIDQAAVEAAAIQLEADRVMQNLRSKRNDLLAETDYLALADSTLTDEMRTYRQALRDLPANTADPANPVWPEKPE